MDSTRHGRCANVGAIDLSQLFQELENRARQGNLEIAADLCGRAQAEFGTVRAELEAELERG